MHFIAFANQEVFTSMPLFILCIRWRNSGS